MSNKKKRLELVARGFYAEADLAFSLHCLGNKLAEQNEYAEHEGIEAVRHYLCLRHNWLPGQVSDLSYAAIRSLVSELLTHHKLTSEELSALKAGRDSHY